MSREIETAARVSSGSIADARRSGKGARKSGRVILRYSGTEPLARVMVEAERDEDVRRWTDSLHRLSLRIGAYCTAPRPTLQEIFLARS